MHLLRNSSPIRYASGTIQPGEWLCNDDNAFQLAAMAERESVKLTHYNRALNPEWMKLDDRSNLGGGTTRRIVLIRSGAIGDLLLLSPCIAPLRERYPDAKIYLCCFDRHEPVIKDFGFDEELPYPLAASWLKDFDLIIPLENIVELSTEKGQHATDAYAEALGVTVTDYRPVYKVTEDEAELAARMFCKVDNTTNTLKKRVALHLHASAQVRGYPIKQWGQVMQTLIERGWEIMLLGAMDGVRDAPPAVKDCSKLTFREAAAVLSTCDVFCGVDSSFFNLCPALGVPAIGLFGPVDWRTRVKKGSGQRALHGEGCSPCGWTNSRAGSKFPPLGPCFQKQQCVILEDIKPERVVSVIEAEAKK